MTAWRYANPGAMATLQALGPAGSGPQALLPDDLVHRLATLKASGRGNRTDRPPRRMGAAHRLCPEPGMAGGGLAGHDRGGQYLGAPVPEQQFG